MGMFDKIKRAIWGKEQASKPEAVVRTASAPVTASAAPSAPAPAPAAAPSIAADQPAASPAASAATNAAAAPTPSQPVDVASILDDAVKASGQNLNWRTSIVDLMKALNLDSSLSARKELADDLDYTGDKNDSASMNIWLHKALMKKLAENGGKVPSELVT